MATSSDIMQQAVANFAAEARDWGNPNTMVLFIATPTGIIRSLVFPKTLDDAVGMLGTMSRDVTVEIAKLQTQMEQAAPPVAPDPTDPGPVAVIMQPGKKGLFRR